MYIYIICIYVCTITYVPLESKRSVAFFFGMPVPL